MKTSFQHGRLMTRLRLCSTHLPSFKATSVIARAFCSSRDDRRVWLWLIREEYQSTGCDFDRLWLNWRGAQGKELACGLIVGMDG